jgi:pimeloyl-ACP methyl ester carboxylesterase
MARRLTALALLLALAAAACGGDDADVAETGVPPTTAAQESTTATTAAEETTTSTTIAEPPSGDDAEFYESLPLPLAEDPPGTVLAVEDVDPSSVPGAAQVLRVAYQSESIAGEPIVVTGIIAVPAGPAPEGGRPVLSWAHGTTGIADVCAPSHDPADAVGFLAPFLEQGMVVVATDYEGLGTPGVHPYVAGESEGRGVLDIVRAAQTLDIGAGDRVILWGHSQGGHAVLFANQIAPDWAPELTVLGTVAGAPPSQLSLIADALVGGPFQYYIVMAGAGWAEAFGADLSLMAGPAALEQLPLVDQVCADGLAEAFNDIPPDELLIANPADVEPWASLLVENDPGFVVGASPVLIIHGEEDEQIPVVSSQLLLDRMCGIGQVVERRTYPGASHSGVIQPSFADMVDWMNDRLFGVPAESDCPA